MKGGASTGPHIHKVTLLLFKVRYFISIYNTTLWFVYGKSFISSQGYLYYFTHNTPRLKVEGCCVFKQYWLLSYDTKLSFKTKSCCGKYTFYWDQLFIFWQCVMVLITSCRYRKLWNLITTFQRIFYFRQNTLVIIKKVSGIIHIIFLFIEIVWYHYSLTNVIWCLISPHPWSWVVIVHKTIVTL